MVSMISMISMVTMVSSKSLPVKVINLLLHEVYLLHNSQILILQLLAFPQAINLVLQDGIFADIFLEVEHLMKIDLSIINIDFPLALVELVLPLIFVSDL